MSRTAYIHVNGHNFEFAYPIKGGDQDPDYQQLERDVAKLASGGGDQLTVEVLIDGRRSSMHFTTQGVFAAGVSLAPEAAQPWTGIAR